jgi:alpha-L-fucosidase 2
LLAADTDYLADYSAGYRGTHPSSLLTSQLQTASGRSYNELRTEHVTGYQNLYNRVSLNLNTDPAIDVIDTDVRLNNYKTGTTDRGLEALLFQYGRYMLISSSRPSEGAIGANLQGLWNNSNSPAWASDYHTNINIQMNYWPAEVTNLSECHRVLLDQVASQVPIWRTRTNEAFSTRGWTVRTSHNLYGGMAWNWNKPGNAWYAHHFWEHYAFSQDPDYLGNIAYPLLKEVCQFWQDHLVERDHPDSPGTKVLVSPNDWSPEHGPWEDGVSYAQQFIYDVFTNYIEASVKLDIDPTFRAEVSDMRDRLLMPRIGSWGQLREWMLTDDSSSDTHRHLSHLVAAYPGHQITLETTPALAEAVKVSLNARGIGGPGWSRSWKINLWARLREAQKAYEAIDGQLKNTIYNNLFNVHPPFQIDGNFGYTAGVAEMLLQSHDSAIHLLPALPSSWPDGDVTGLCARGGLEVDMKWADGQLTLATIRPKKDGVYNLRYGTVEVVLDATAGEVYYWNGQWKNDLNLNGKIDLTDFSMIAQEWLSADCGESNNWCLGKDVNRDNKVDAEDLVSICQGWLNELVLE